MGGTDRRDLIGSMEIPTNRQDKELAGDLLGSLEEIDMTVELLKVCRRRFTYRGLTDSSNNRNQPTQKTRTDLQGGLRR